MKHCKVCLLQGLEKVVCNRWDIMYFYLNLSNIDRRINPVLVGVPCVLVQNAVRLRAHGKRKSIVTTVAQSLTFASLTIYFEDINWPILMTKLLNNLWE